MAEIVKAFIARSFADVDEERLKPLLDHLKTFESLGFYCESAEPAEATEVSEKIQKLIQGAAVFIGMFTQKYSITKQSAGTNAADPSPTGWTAPSWVLQESGYALGRGKKLIFFVEPNVELPQLQGDLEYIVYDPARRDEAFSRANEVVTKIIAGSLQLKAEPSLRQQAQAPPAEVPAQQEIKPDKPGLGSYIREIFKGLRSGDPGAAEKAYKEGLEGLKREDPNDPEKGLFFTAFYHQQRATHGYPEGLDDLRSLENEHPNSHDVALFIGRGLQELGDFPGAAEAFQRAAAKGPLDKKADFLVYAAECWTEAKDTASAKNLLVEAFRLATPKQRLEVMSKLYENLKSAGKKYDAFAIGEYSLRGNGAQSDLRFKLAYDHAESGLNDIAAYHYHVVLEQREMDGAMNNLANILGPLGFPVSSIENYKGAIKLGNTLAAGNLAFRLLDAGMAEEAKAVVDQAMKASNPDAKVTDALAAISRSRQEEGKKYGELLKGTAEKRSFFAAMGEASLSKDKADVAGRWAFPLPTIDLQTEGDHLTGIARNPIYPSGLALALTPDPDRTKPTGTEIHTFEGTLSGRVCSFSLSVETKSIHGFASLMNRNETRKGYLVFGADGKSAKVLEIEPKINFYEISREIPVETDPGIHQ